jgi:hypothetical protein
LLQAVLDAPAFLSGLSVVSKNDFRRRASLGMAPEEVMRKEQLSDALETARQSIKQAGRKIAKRAQLLETINGWKPTS